MTSGRRVAVVLVAFVGVGLLVWLSRPPASEPTGRAAVTGGRKKETRAEVPELRGDATPSRPSASSSLDSAEEESPSDPATWRLEVRVYDGYGQLLRSVPHPGGGTSVPVTLRFVSDGGDPAVRGDPDEDGVTRLVVRGSGRIAAFPEPPWRPVPSEGLSPPASGRRELSIRLMEGLEISGMVLDPRGDPLADVEIDATLATLASWGKGRRRDWTRADGTFRLQGLAEGVYRLEGRIHLRGKREDVGRFPPATEVQAGTEGVVIRLLPPSAFLLRFVDESTGEPAGGWVNLYVRSGEDETWLGGVSGATEYKVETPPPEGSVLRVEAEGYSPRDVPHTAFLVHADDRTLDVPLHADPESMVPVVLTLRDEAGRAVEEVGLSRLMALGRDSDTGTWAGDTVAAPGGKLALRYGVGPCRLEIDPFPSSPRPETPPRKEWLRFLLPRSLGIDLARGEPVEKAIVFQTGGAVLAHGPASSSFGFTLQDGEGGRVPNGTKLRTLQNGAREIFPVPPGAWKLTWWIGSEKIPAPDDVVVKKGAVTEVRWDPHLLDR